MYSLIPVTFLLILGLYACTQPEDLVTSIQPNRVTPTITATAIQTSTPTATQQPTSSPTPSQTTALEQKTLWISSGTDIFNRVISVDPHNHQRFAYCSDEEILTSDDGGEAWKAVPTGGVAAAAEQVGYQIFDNNPSLSNACMYLSLDSSHPDSYYAVFTMAHEDYGAPPIFYVGFYTTDSGVSWRPVPPPANSDYEAFGGIWTDGDGRVEALFTKPKDLADPAEPVYVQVTEDGGETWDTGSLSCPAVGPCLRWGPSVSNIPGMGSPLPQDILISMDDGETWSIIEPAIELRADPPNQLAAFSENEAQIISGSIFLSNTDTSPQPVRDTQDGGLTWHVVDLPQLPIQSVSPNYFPGLQILPDGSYLSQSADGVFWYWLPAMSNSWCEVDLTSLPVYPMLLHSVGDQLWWVDSDTGKAELIHLSEISCVEN